MNSIPWYKSGVYVGALVALITQVGAIFGVSELSETNVRGGVESLMQLVSAGATLWALISRHRSKIQPVTLTEKK